MMECCLCGIGGGDGGGGGGGGGGPSEEINGCGQMDSRCWGDCGARQMNREKREGD